MISRLTYTKIFLKQKGWPTDDANVKHYMMKWWQSHRTKDQGGLCLSPEGFEFLTRDLDLNCYTVTFSEPIELSPQTILFFDRYIDCPYIMSNRNITVFSEKKNFELHLFSHDIEKYGLIKAMKNKLGTQD